MKWQYVYRSNAIRRYSRFLSSVLERLDPYDGQVGGECRFRLRRERIAYAVGVSAIGEMVEVRPSARRDVLVPQAGSGNTTITARALGPRSRPCPSTPPLTSSVAVFLVIVVVDCGKDFTPRLKIWEPGLHSGEAAKGRDDRDGVTG